jgi:hypothetical protein
VRVVDRPESDCRSSRERSVDGSTRLLKLATARHYLGGKHPSDFGIEPVSGSRGKAARYDLRVIDAFLDRLGGLTPTGDGRVADYGERNVQEEQDELARKIDAARRS